LNKIYRKIKNEKYTKEEIEFLIQIIEILTQNKIGQEKAKEILNKIQIGGDDNMLAVFDVIQRTNQEMISKGRKEGRKEKQIEDIKNMLKEKLPIELISRITGMSEDEINKYKR
jgi:NCAIR mutase (PurE)-related protein